MKIALINGSPKINNSASGALLEDVKRYLGETIEVINFGFHSSGISKEVIEELKKIDVWVFSYPLFVDGIPGHLLSCLVQLEERGEGEAIARNLLEMSDLKVPIIAIIIGEGGSGGALALGLADEVWMLEQTIYAVLSPEGFASILWKDGSRAAEAAELMKVAAAELLELDVIDRVIPETVNGQTNQYN